MTAETKKKKTQANVRVVSRIRPLAKYELEKGCQPVVVKVPKADSDDGGPEALQVNQANGNHGGGGGGGDKRWFELDAVLDERSSQQDVYEKSGAYTAITEDLFQGYNCTILAYGQTGSGKTFTMGTASASVNEQDADGTKSSPPLRKEDGLIPRACWDLFDTIHSKCDANAHVEMSYLEVYNEEIRDLMSVDNKNNQLRIRETLNGEVYVRGLQSRTVSTPSDVGRLMEEAGGRRVVASTKMNAVSSRSHAICVLRLKGVLEDATKFQAKLTLVDLAGSERIEKTGATGTRAQEGININKGLFVLGQVVSALAEQRPKFKRRPPFRDSKLTRLLQDSLGGNSRTIMIACCSPADFNIEETINTLRYATQARNIKNTATANVVQQISQEEAMKLKRENALLKSQVSELQDTIRRLTKDVTEEDLERSQSMIMHQQQIHESQQNLTIDDGLEGISPIKSMPSPDGGKPPFQSLDVFLNANNQMQQQQQQDEDDENTLEPSLGMDQVFSQQQTTNGATDVSVAPSEYSMKSYADLQQENELLAFKLRQAQGDIRATVHESAIELPAMKARVMMLEEELNESRILEQETLMLKQELEEAKADKASAMVAAQHLAEFMEQQKLQHGFRGDELQKKRMWYYHKRLEEKWTDFVVVVLTSFKEQMRLLGDYFDMVVRVVESPDILTMLGPKSLANKKTWWGGNAGYKLSEIAEEKELRHRLLGEHIKFFNERLLEIEDEIDSRSANVEELWIGLIDERRELEQELDKTDFCRDLFSKKGEKLLKRLTELMTGPLFTMPLIFGDESNGTIGTL